MSCGCSKNAESCGCGSKVMNWESYDRPSKTMMAEHDVEILYERWKDGELTDEETLSLIDMLITHDRKKLSHMIRWIQDENSEGMSNLRMGIKERWGWMGAEEPTVQEPDFMPNGDGRAIGQQNFAINLSPLHAESKSNEAYGGFIINRGFDSSQVMMNVSGLNYQKVGIDSLSKESIMKLDGNSQKVMLGRNQKIIDRKRSSKQDKDTARRFIEILKETDFTFNLQEYGAESFNAEQSWGYVVVDGEGLRTDAFRTKEQARFYAQKSRDEAGRKGVRVVKAKKSDDRMNKAQMDIIFGKGWGAEGHKYVECDFCSEKKPLGQMRRMPYDPEQGDLGKRVRYSGYKSTYAICDGCYRDRIKGNPVGKSVLHAESFNAESGFKCKFCGSKAEGLDTWDDDYCSRACEKGLTVCGISDGKGQNGSYGEFCDIQYVGKSDADDNKIIIHIGCPNCEFSEDGWGMSFNQEMEEGYRAETTGSPSPTFNEDITGQDGPSADPTNQNFEAMARYAPSKSDVDEARRKIKAHSSWGEVVYDRYLVNQQGSSNKFYYTAIAEKDGRFYPLGAWGRIGYMNTVKIYNALGKTENPSAHLPTMKGAYRVVKDKEMSKINARKSEKRYVDSTLTKWDAESLEEIEGPTAEATAGGLHSPSSFDMTWEDGTGQSSASIPPNEIAWAENTGFPTWAKLGAGIAVLYGVGKVITARVSEQKSADNAVKARKGCCGKSAEAKTVRKNSEFSVGQINPVVVEGESDVHGAEEVKLSKPHQGPQSTHYSNERPSQKMW
jgi:hypothetical protein